jgi:hypothetical protein
VWLLCLMAGSEDRLRAFSMIPRFRNMLPPDALYVLLKTVTSMLNEGQEQMLRLLPVVSVIFETLRTLYVDPAVFGVDQSTYQGPATPVRPMEWTLDVVVKVLCVVVHAAMFLLLLLSLLQLLLSLLQLLLSLLLSLFPAVATGSRTGRRSQVLRRGGGDTSEFRGPRDIVCRCAHPVCCAANSHRPHQRDVSHTYACTGFCNHHGCPAA